MNENDWIEEEVIELEKDREPIAILANKGSRIAAFALDLILISTFTLMILSTVIYPGIITELGELANQHDLSQSDLIAKMSPQLKEKLEISNTIFVLSFWLYFAANEIILKGASLGKRIFSIRAVNEITLEPPSIFDSILRAGLKTLSLLAWFPVFILGNFCLIFFTKKGQAGHDFLSRTIVIQDTLETQDKKNNWD